MKIPSQSEIDRAFDFINTRCPRCIRFLGEPTETGQSRRSGLFVYVQFEQKCECGFERGYWKKETIFNRKKASNIRRTSGFRKFFTLTYWRFQMAFLLGRGSPLNIVEMVTFEIEDAVEQAGAADRDPGAQPSTVDEDRNHEVRGG